MFAGRSSDLCSPGTLCRDDVIGQLVDDSPKNAGSNSTIVDRNCHHETIAARDVEEIGLDLRVLNQKVLKFRGSFFLAQICRQPNIILAWADFRAKGNLKRGSGHVKGELLLPCFGVQVFDLITQVFDQALQSGSVHDVCLRWSRNRDLRGERSDRNQRR